MDFGWKREKGEWRERERPEQTMRKWKVEVEEKRRKYAVKMEGGTEREWNRGLANGMGRERARGIK
jgi:hypothetical protein